MPRSFSGANLSDAAAFRASYAGIRSLTDGDYRISFDVAGEEIKTVFDVLTQGGKPSAAKGTWFAIARLNIGGAATPSLPQPTTAETDASQDNGNAASGPHKPSPARSLSQHIYRRLCLEPKGRAFLEEFCQDICLGRKLNDAETAKAAVRDRLGIASLSEVDGDPVVSEQAEQLLNLYAGWERGYGEAPRILKENQA